MFVFVSEDYACLWSGGMGGGGGWLMEGGGRGVVDGGGRGWGKAL